MDEIVLSEEKKRKLDKNAAIYIKVRINDVSASFPNLALFLIIILN